MKKMSLLQLPLEETKFGDVFDCAPKRVGGARARKAKLLKLLDKSLDGGVDCGAGSDISRSGG